MRPFSLRGPSQQTVNSFKEEKKKKTQQQTFSGYLVLNGKIKDGDSSSLSLLQGFYVFQKLLYVFITSVTATELACPNPVFWNYQLQIEINVHIHAAARTLCIYLLLIMQEYVTHEENVFFNVLASDIFQTFYKLFCSLKEI